MTFELLSKIMKENDIPKNVKLLSDSGWECSETEMNGIYYNRNKNEMIFTQYGDVNDNQFDSKKWELLYGYNKPCQSCRHLIGDICDSGYFFYEKNCNSCEKYERR